MKEADAPASHLVSAPDYDKVCAVAFRYQLLADRRRTSHGDDDHDVNRYEAKAEAAWEVAAAIGSLALDGEVTEGLVALQPYQYGLLCEAQGLDLVPAARLEPVKALEPSIA